MATKTINAIFFENASPLRNGKKCTRVKNQVKKVHFKTPIISKKTPNPTLSFITKVFSGPKKSETQNFFF